MHLATLLWRVATCCDMLGVVLVQIWKWSNFSCNICGVAWCCRRLTRFVQQCCTGTCPLVRFSTRNMSQHIATGWPNACNMLCATMLRSVALRCCYRVARAIQYSIEEDHLELTFLDQRRYTLYCKLCWWHNGAHSHCSMQCNPIVIAFFFNPGTSNEHKLQ